MLGNYELECTEPSCKGHVIITEAQSVGWKVGDVVHTDKANPNHIRCPHCKRGKMRVTKVPKSHPEVPIKGFVKLHKK
jgi:hypothetical protein